MARGQSLPSTHKTTEATMVNAVSDSTTFRALLMTWWGDSWPGIKDWSILETSDPFLPPSPSH